MDKQSGRPFSGLMFVHATRTGQRKWCERFAEARYRDKTQGFDHAPMVSAARGLPR
jgi:hypothetical protein